MLPHAARGRFCWSSVLIALCLCLFAATGFWFQAVQGLRPDDDTLWLYYASRKVDDPTKGRDLENAIIAAAQAHNASEESIKSLEIRRDYWLNYALPVYSWNWLQAVLPAVESVAKYPQYLGRTVPLMFAVSAGIAWLILIGVLVYLRDRRMLTAAALAVGVIALLSLLPKIASTQILMIMKWPELFIKNFILMWINPSYPFNIFGYTPRNYLAVLVIALFALRWSGVGVRWIYLFLLPFFTIHSSLAFLLLVQIIVLDLIRKRSLLRDWVIISLFAIGFTYGIWRETLWVNVASSFFIQAAIFVLFMVFLLAIWVKDPLGWVQRWFPGVSQWLSTTGTWLSRRSPWTGDLTLIVVFWVAILPVVLLISRFTSYAQNYNFWYQLHGRAIGLFEAVFYFGAALILVTHFRTFHWNMAVAAIAMLWSVGFVYKDRSAPLPWNKYAAQVQSIETALSAHEGLGSSKGFEYDHGIVYYALGQMLTLHNDRLDDLQWNVQDSAATRSGAPEAAALERERVAAMWEFPALNG